MWSGWHTATVAKLSLSIAHNANWLQQRYNQTDVLSPLGVNAGSEYANEGGSEADRSTGVLFILFSFPLQGVLETAGMFKLTGRIYYVSEVAIYSEYFQSNKIPDTVDKTRCKWGLCVASACWMHSVLHTTHWPVSPLTSPVLLARKSSEAEGCQTSVNICSAKSDVSLSLLMSLDLSRDSDNEWVILSSCIGLRPGLNMANTVAGGTDDACDCVRL